MFKYRNAKFIIVESVKSIILVGWLLFWRRSFAFNRLNLLQIEHVFVLNTWWSNLNGSQIIVIRTRNSNGNLDSSLFLRGKFQRLRRSLDRNVLLHLRLITWRIINVVINVLIVIGILELTWTSSRDAFYWLQVNALFFHIKSHSLRTWRSGWNLLIIRENTTSGLAFNSLIIGKRMTDIT